MKRLAVAALALALASPTRAQSQQTLSQFVSGDTTTGFKVGRLIVSDSLKVPASFGQLLSHTTASASSLSLVTATAKTLDSLILTAGTWDVGGVVDFTLGATTTVTLLVGSLSTTAAALGGQDSWFKFETASNIMTATDDPAWVLPTVQFVVASGTTKVYLIALAKFGASTAKAYGTIRARRIG